MSSSLEHTNGDTTVKTQLKKSSNLSICRICGDKARFINYGALSCQSCKTFFRRNGFHPQTDRPCVFNTHCEINMQTRHTCAACRLAKCLMMGMSPDLIRKEDCKRTKNLSSLKQNDVEQVVSKPITTTQIITLNFPQGDRAHFINSDWTLISNIVHAHDKYSIDSQVRLAIDSLSTYPVAMHCNMINPLGIVRQLYKSILSFISSSPDFRILTLNEQISLVERNLHGIIGLSETFLFRNTGILHNPSCMEAFTIVYESDMMLIAKNLNERLDSDSTVVKLILFILGFSSNCLILNVNEKIEDDRLSYGTFRLLGSQNVYVELLWKYMIYRYGYYDSVLRFSRLIQMFLCVLENLSIVHNSNEAHRKMANNAIAEIKLSLTMNVNEQTLLWGKI
ncbi:unnamed protein product [Rotaria sp. Silwood2]|nr:unnamed protein product [Rotaria sp. Silwood2]CAF2694781.1 unnamed protein product [Rotaria sp. Silwood2]CAF2944763.1 unnamed protein product [Rotaria sp. Silwood2]CAF3089172.1 unnamed protein product [Rotaria sp. Silwood2]CAF4386855.1 unnamed protein product [Rotaria sp. Silwood2]